MLATSFNDRLVSLRADAVEQGASEEQIAGLDAAINTGGVDFETASEAARRAVDCMQDAGLVADFKIDTRESGFKVPMYVAALPVGAGDAAMAMVDDCDRTEQYFVSLAYQTQPSAKAAQDALIGQRLPILIACLDEHGREVPKNATQDELVRAAIDYITEQFQAGVASELVVDCLLNAGIDSA